MSVYILYNHNKGTRLERVEAIQIADPATHSCKLCEGGTGGIRQGHWGNPPGALGESARGTRRRRIAGIPIRGILEETLRGALLETW
jgi:hypothetical protein